MLFHFFCKGRLFVIKDCPYFNTIRFTSISTVSTLINETYTSELTNIWEFICCNLEDQLLPYFLQFVNSFEVCIYKLEVSALLIDFIFPSRYNMWFKQRNWVHSFFLFVLFVYCYGSFTMIVEVVANVVDGHVLPDICESYQVVEPGDLLHLTAIIVRLLLRIATLIMSLFLFAEFIIVFPECPLCIRWVFVQFKLGHFRFLEFHLNLR